MYGSGPTEGVSSYVDGQFTPVAGPRGHEDIRVRAVLEDSQGALWVGTDGAGAYRLDARGMTVFDRNDGLSGATVTALAEDHLSRIWIGTNEGLDLIEHDQVTSMQSLFGAAGPAAVHLIYEDRGHNLWVATEARGLFLIGAHGTRHLGMADGLPSDWVISIHEDERGILWLGTTDGLALWRDGKLISLAHFGGPLRETIMQLLEDDAHQMWLTTNKGLISVARAGLDALASGATSLPQFHTYGVADGLRTRRVRRRQHLGRMSFAGRISLVPERARHRAGRPGPHSHEYPAATRTHRTDRRRRAAADAHRGNRSTPGCAAMGISLHRTQPADAAALAVSLSARGLRQGMDRRRQPQNRLLHRTCPRYLHLPRDREQ